MSALEEPTAPLPLDEGLWVVDAPPILFLTFPYALRMTLVRLTDGSLFVHSPCQPHERLLSEVAALGEVRHLVSPNKLHNVFLGQWSERFENARVYAPPGLPERRPDIRFDAVLGDEPEPAWADVLDQVLVGPSWFMDEVVFVHRATRTVILGDLIEHHDPAALSPLQRVVARANAMFGQTPRNYRVTFTRRAHTRLQLERVLACRPTRVLVMHGDVVDVDAEGYLRRGWSWILGS